MADDVHPRPPDPTESLEHLGRLSLREVSMDGLLQTVADQAEAVVPGEPESVATRFGSYAAVAAGNLHSYRSARETAQNLQVALESRAVIDQAKGILRERHELTADQAFQLLAQASMRGDTEVRDVADHLVTTGEFPLR